MKKKIKEIKNIIILALIVSLFIYAIYSIFVLIDSPTDVFLLTKGEVSQEESTLGYIIRDETIINQESYGEDIEKIKTEGEKVSKGETIFKYYTVQKEEINAQITALDNEIQTALESQNDIFSSDINALDGQIENKLLSIIEKNNIQEIKEHKTDINNYTTKKAKIAGELSPAGSYIKTLIDNKNSLEKSLLEGSKTITSPKAGIVSYRIDNLEEVLTPENFSNITKELLEQTNLKTGRVISTSNEQAKIVDNFKCYLAVISSSKEAMNAKVGDSLNVKLSTGEEVKTTINCINEQKNSRILILKITKNVEQLINYRKISVDLIWWQAEGLKVPNSAILYENGLSYVVKRENNKEKKVLVKIKKESEKYSIVGSYNTEELIGFGFSQEEINKLQKIKLYDEIVVQPTI